MPLHAQAELCARLLNALHDAVLTQGRQHKAGGDLVHRLMVLAVDQHGILPQNAREQGIPPHGDGVDLAPMVVVGDVLKGFDVLIQIAAQRNIHQLDAPADGQHRLVGGKEGAQQQRFGGIPQNVGLTAGGNALLPVEFRVDVAAARQQQAVTGQRILHGRFRVVQLDPAHLCPGPGKAFGIFGLSRRQLRVSAHSWHCDRNTHFNCLAFVKQKPGTIGSGHFGGKMGIRTPERF